MVDFKTVCIVAATLFVMYMALKLCAALDLFGSRSGKKSAKKVAPAGGATCPLCGSQLLQGEQLNSRVFGPIRDSAEGQSCSIMGCPHCYPAIREPGLKRACPVCGKPVSQDGSLNARLFTKTKDGKKHLIVTGCPNCGRKG